MGVGSVLVRFFCFYASWQPDRVGLDCADTSLTVPAEEFNAAVDAWQGGPMGDFSDSSGWTYQIWNECSQPPLVLQELSQSDAAETLGAESGESNVFGAYDRVKFTDDHPEISVTVSSSDATCNIAVSIRNSEHVSPTLDVRLYPPPLLMFSAEAVSVSGQYSPRALCGAM